MNSETIENSQKEIQVFSKTSNTKRLVFNLDDRVNSF